MKKRIQLSLILSLLLMSGITSTASAKKSDVQGSKDHPLVTRMPTFYIDRYEKNNRTFYGGAIGFMDFEGNFNHAIIIRSFLSKNHRLYYQAGAGIVAKSDPQSELQEVYNKLGALKKALELAENI